MANLGSLVGFIGTLACPLSMVAASSALIAAGGTAAVHGGMAGMGQTDHSGMAGMSQKDHHGTAGMGSTGRPTGHGANEASAAQAPGWLDALLRFGPVILVVSVLLVAASVALRRRLAALPAIGGGLILYVGMYAQPNLALMYGAIVVSTALLVLAYAASLRRSA